MMLLDEPSMGLAPQLVEEIFEIVRDLNEKEGVSFLLAEQNTNVALRFADYGYILENGRVVMDGAAASAARERGREGVLPRHVGRRPQVLPRREATAAASAGWLNQPQQRGAGRSCSIHSSEPLRARHDRDHYDPLETRAPEARERALLARAAARRSRMRSATRRGSRRMLAGVDAARSHRPRGAGAAAGDAQVRAGGAAEGRAAVRRPRRPMPGDARA